MALYPDLTPEEAIELLICLTLFAGTMGILIAEGCAWAAYSLMCDFSPVLGLEKTTLLCVKMAGHKEVEAWEVWEAGFCFIPKLGSLFAIPRP